MPDYIDEALKRIEEFEGSIPWMYRDASGRVTAGVGLVLKDPETAGGLPFHIGDREATAEELAREFARVDAMPGGRPALFYRREGGAEMSGEAMRSLARGVVERMAVELEARLAGFDGMPDTAKTALLDMAYSLGVDGLLQGCPELVKAVEAGAWRMAAAKSFRARAVAGRNEWTRTMLLRSARGAEADGVGKRLSYGVLGMVASWVGR